MEHTNGEMRRSGGILEIRGQMIADARLMSAETANTWGLETIGNVYEWESNARRLVACWNACDGIGTDELEKIEVKRNMRVAAMEYAALSADRDRLQAINAELVAALERKFHGGSRVINCIQHGGGKPEECRLCVADLKNQLSYAIRVNEFLNSVLDDARAALAKSKEA